MFLCYFGDLLNKGFGKQHNISLNVHDYLVLSTDEETEPLRDFCLTYPNIGSESVDYFLSSRMRILI